MRTENISGLLRNRFMTPNWAKVGTVVELFFTFKDIA